MLIRMSQEGGESDDAAERGVCAGMMTLSRNGRDPLLRKRAWHLMAAWPLHTWQQEGDGLHAFTVKAARWT